MTFGAGFGFPRARFPMGAAPTLSMDFAGTAALPPYVTFSRGTNATYVDSLGNIAYAPSNLLTYSEQFDNAAWAKTNATVTANTVVAPNDTYTADTLDFTNASAYIYNLYNPAVNLAGITFVFSVWLASATKGKIAIRIAGSVTGTGGETLVTLTPTLTRYSVAVTVPVGNTAILVGFENRAVLGGDGLLGTILAWGAQLNLGALQPYNSTTVKNLLGYTQDFDNAAWTKSDSSITQNVITAPDGSLTADKLVENTATAGHNVANAVGVTTVSGSTYTMSVYAKAAERSFVALYDSISAKGKYFDLTNGTVLGNLIGAPLNASISSIGNGWLRCSIVISASASAQLVIFTSTNGSNFSYTGDGTSGIYIWGAQLSDSASLDPYSYNFTTAPTAAAYYGPRFDYDPTTLACEGLLIEEQRTNLLTYSDDLNNYQAINNATVATNVVNAPDGLATADSLTATLSATSNTCWVQKLATIAANTSAYTAFAFVKEGSSPTTAINLALSGGTYQEVFATLTFSTKSLVLSGGMAGSATGAVKEFSNGWYQVSVSFANNGTNTVAALREYVTATSGSTVGFYTYFWGLQLEAGAFPTSYIPTTTTAVTRAADVAVIQGANFSNWYNQSEGTFVTVADTVSNSQNGGIIGLDDGTTTNLMRSFIGGVTPVFTITNATVNQAYLTPSPLYSVGVANKVASAYAANDFASVSSGGAVAVDSLGTSPTILNRALIGSGVAGVVYLNGHIARIAYYSTRQPNATLQAITT